MADFGGDETPELAAFRAEAREWLEEKFRVRAKSARHDHGTDGRGAKPTADAELWRQRIGEKGWGTPTWPKAVRRRRPLAGRGAGAGRGDGADRRPQPHRGHGPRHVRPHPARIRHRGTEAAPHPADLPRRAALVPGLLRAGLRLGPRVAADQGRGQGRPLAGQRPEDLDLRRPVRRLVLLPRAAPTRPRSTRASASS